MKSKALIPDAGMGIVNRNRVIVSIHFPLFQRGEVNAYDLLVLSNRQTHLSGTL